MSPASKFKTASRAVKEHHKVSKPSVAPANGGNGTLTSTYEPASGMFHALESSLQSPQSNGRFKTMDDTEEHSGSSLGTAADYDSVSNNDSCSGESEDQQKEKPVPGLASRTEPIPGSDIDRREKIRQKNEKKHQRQKEKRAQELHERCCSYLTSRKLESLAQKLVAMGFTSEQSTMALIQNEGRLEESALWLTEGNEESRQQSPINLDGVNSRINIADELAKIAEMVKTLKCTKQEVERAVVACEGDLEKAEETLRSNKQESSVASLKLEESSNHLRVSTNGLNINRQATSSLSSAGVLQQQGVAPSVVQHRRDERDFNYTKSAVTADISPVEAASRNFLTLRKMQLKPDPPKSQSPPTLEKRSPNTSPVASTVQVMPAHTLPEARYVTNVSNAIKPNLQAGTLREPIVMMQRPQSNVSRPNPSASIGLSASPPATTGWYPSGTNPMARQVRNLSLNGSSSQQYYPQNLQQQFNSTPMESNSTGWGASWSSQGTTATRSSFSSATQSVPSLGLFTGWGSTGPSNSSSHVDWSTRGSMPQCHYASIDWSLDSTPLPLPSSSIKAERLYDSTWRASYMTSKASRPLVDGGAINGSLMADHPTSAPGSHEWTSFGGKDLFRAPRQFVTSPSPQEMWLI